LKKAADREQRSMVNMLEVLLGDYCDRKGIVPSGQKVHPALPTSVLVQDVRLHVGAAA
jgi:hypothetical protein